MTDLASRILCAVGAPAFYARRHRRLLAILTYHGVTRTPLSPPCWHQLPLEDFRRQMEWVAERYRVLPLDEALPAMRDGALPERSCAITFDDGFLNVRTNALPVLEALGLPATVFLSTGPVADRPHGEVLWPDRLHLAFAAAAAPAIDLGRVGLGVLPLRTPGDRAEAASRCAERLKELPRAEKEARLGEVLARLGAAAGADPGEFRMLTWDDVHALAATGRVRIAGHTVRHEILSRCEDAVVEEEVRASHETVSRRLGRVPTVFAYPNGRPQDFDARSREAVRACGIPFALSTEEGLARREDDPFALPRLSIGSDLSFARFRLLVSGALQALRGSRRSPSGYGARTGPSGR